LSGVLQRIRGVLLTMLGREPSHPPDASAGTGDVDDWFRITFDHEYVRLDVAPPGREPWKERFAWASIVRVCFKAEGLEASDGVYVFISSRPESYAIPAEADGGAEFWTEIIRRGLFDAELAIEAATASEGLFCWPPA
jgi:hypothetical protein